LTVEQRFAALESALAALRQLFPGESAVGISLLGPASFRHVNVANHNPKTMAEATEWLRQWGVGTREKTPYAPAAGMAAYTRISGASGGIDFTAYPDELPSTCHLVEVVERVPKSCVTVFEGEFVEVTRVKVMCYDGAAGAAAEGGAA
jgi:hypothetical protein